MELKEKILRQLCVLQNQSIADMVNYDVKSEWGTQLVEGACKAVIRECGSNFAPIPSWEKQSPWEKLCTYKISDYDCDCDVALRSVIIYWLVFLEKQEQKDWHISANDGEKFCLKKREDADVELRGDTMNSFSTPVIGRNDNGLLRHYLIDETYPGANRLIDSILEKKSKKMKDKYHHFDKNKDSHSTEWYAAILDNYSLFAQLFAEMTQKIRLPKEGVYHYCKMTHTLGNLVPVPFHWSHNIDCQEHYAEFNSPRGTKSTKDYWDLALFHIRKWYCTSEVKHLSSIVGSNKSHMDNCRRWLESFGSGQNGWNKFVEQNFMQDFVNVDPDGNYGMPKEFWPGHFKGEVMPSNPEEYQQFFTNTCDMITARGDRIATKVKEVLNRETLAELAEEMTRG